MKKIVPRDTMTELL